MHSGVDVTARGQRRQTLALLVADLERVHQTPIWAGVSEMAREADVNLLCFVGGRLGGGVDAPHEVQRNGLYELVMSGLVDGVIIASSVIGHRRSDRELQAFIRRFRSIPTVSVGMDLEGVPSVTVDAAPGLRAGIAHLVEDHGAQRIAFIRGPEGRREADHLYEVYCEELARHGLPFDAELVAPGDMTSNDQACRLLVDERGLTFDALVAANDRMALSAMSELQSRGLRVPQDVAVLGHGDGPDSRFSLPHLTTVRQPTSAMGRAATEMVLTLMRGGQVDDVRLPSELVVRRSCGCLGMHFPGAQSSSPAHPSSPTHMSLDSDLPAVSGRLGIGRDQVIKLAELLSSEIEEPAHDETFLAQLDQDLLQVSQDVDFDAWHQLLSSWRGRALSGLPDRPLDLARAESLLAKAHMLVGDAAQQHAAAWAFEVRRLEDAVREIGLGLFAAFDLERIADVLATELPRIGIESCALALYQPDTVSKAAGSEPYTPVPESTELILLVQGGERLSLGAVAEGADTESFASRAFVPAAVLPADRRFSFVVEPLTFKDVQLGYVLLEPGPLEGSVYGTLRGLLSTAVQGALMAGSAVRRADQLQITLDAVRTPDVAVDPDGFAHHVIDVLSHRLGAHFVGIYLREEQWLTLWVGTGAEGARMASDGHRLRSGGSTAVGQCAVTGEPQVARAMDGGPISVGDRYLPDTQSEIALPLVSRGDVLGVLSLRSGAINAFQAGDLSTLTTLGDQIGNAIESSRLLDRTQRALAELQETQGRYQQQAWTDYLEMTPVTEYELGPAQDAGRLSVIDEVNAALAQQVAKSTGPERGVDDTGSSLVVPITYSGATIGALGLQNDGAREWTDDELALVESVVERMGFAVENLRLLDETRRRVAVEQLTQSVTAEMRQTLDVDQVLRSAVQGIGAAFDAAEVTIRLSLGNPVPAISHSDGNGVDPESADLPHEES